MSGRRPFFVLTGVLGSGKTTLLSRLLRDPAMARTGVVVNEFGEIPIDSLLLGQAAEHTVVLAGGCVCCAANGDFVAAVQRLEAQATFERVVIETSGLADPGPILHTLSQSPPLASRYVPAGVIAVVDALQGERELGRQHLAVRQVALADRIVVTKSDIAAPRAVPRLRERLEAINPAAPILVASHGEVAPADLFGEALSHRPPVPVSAAHRHADAAPQAVCLTWDEPVDWARFAPALRRLVEDNAETVLRVKGLLHVAGDPRPTVVQGVCGALYPPAVLAAWPDAHRSSRLVVIAEGLDATSIRAALA